MSTWGYVQGNITRPINIWKNEEFTEFEVTLPELTALSLKENQAYNMMERMYRISPVRREWDAIVKNSGGLVWRGRGRASHSLCKK